MNKKTVFEQLYKDNFGKISSYCYFYLRNQADTEDIVAETFKKAWIQISESGQIIQKPWLYKVSRNIIFNKFSSYEYKNKITSDEIVNNYYDSENLEENITRKEEYLEVIKKLDNLPQDQKEAINLRFIQEMEYPEIAEIMERTINAVQVLVSKGLSTLRLSENDNSTKKLSLFFIPSFINLNQQNLFNSLSTNLFIKTATMTPINNPVLPIASTTAKIATGKLIAMIATSVIVVAGIGSGVWYFIANSNKNNVTTNNSVAQTTTTTTATMTTIENTTTPVIATITTTIAPSPVDPYAGWTTITSKDFGVEFKMPPKLYGKTAKYVTKTTTYNCAEINGYPELTPKDIFKDPNYCTKNPKVMIEEVFTDFGEKTSDGQPVLDLLWGLNSFSSSDYCDGPGNVTTKPGSSVTVFGKTYGTTVFLKSEEDNSNKIFGTCLVRINTPTIINNYLPAFDAGKNSKFKILPILIFGGAGLTETEFQQSTTNGYPELTQKILASFRYI